MKLTKGQIESLLISTQPEDPAQAYFSLTLSKEEASTLCSMAQKWAEVEALVGEGGPREVAEKVMEMPYPGNMEQATKTRDSIANLIAAYTLRERGEVVWEGECLLKEPWSGASNCLMPVESGDEAFWNSLNPDIDAPGVPYHVTITTPDPQGETNV